MSSRSRVRHVLLGLASIVAVAVVVGVWAAGHEGSKRWTSLWHAVQPAWRPGQTEGPEVQWVTSPPRLDHAGWHRAPVYQWQDGRFLWVGYVRLAPSTSHRRHRVSFCLLPTLGTQGRRYRGYAYSGSVPVPDMLAWLASDAEFERALRGFSGVVVDALVEELPVLVERHGAVLAEELHDVLVSTIRAERERVDMVLDRFLEAIVREVTRAELQDRWFRVAQRQLRPVLEDVAQRVRIRVVLAEATRKALRRAMGKDWQETLRRLLEGRWVPTRRDLIDALAVEVERAVEAERAHLAEAVRKAAHAAAADPELREALAEAGLEALDAVEPLVRDLALAALRRASAAEALRTQLQLMLASDALRRDLGQILQRRRDELERYVRQSLFDDDGRLRSSVAFVLKAHALRPGRCFVVLAPAEGERIGPELAAGTAN